MEDIIHMQTEVKGLSVNLKKTECMTISKEKNPPACSIRIDTHEIRQVESFIYLRTLINQVGRCDNKILRWIAMAIGVAWGVASLQLQQVRPKWVTFATGIMSAIPVATKGRGRSLGAKKRSSDFSEREIYDFLAEKFRKVSKILFYATIDLTEQPAATPLQHQSFCPRYAHADDDNHKK